MASARFADLGEGEGARGLSSGSGAAGLRSGSEASGLASGADRRGLGTGQGAKELSSGSGVKELSSGSGAKELSSGSGVKELSSGSGAKELSSGSGARELANGAGAAGLASGAERKLPIALEKSADGDGDGHHAVFHVKVRNVGTVTMTSACVVDHLKHVLDGATGGGFLFMDAPGVSRLGVACLQAPLRPGEVAALSLPVSYPSLSGD